MSSTESKKIVDRKTIVWVIIGALVIYFITGIVTSTRIKDIETIVQTQVNTQHEALVKLAQVATSNDADAETAAIIHDCSNSERNEFYDLLGKLNSGLSQPQLVRLEDVFVRCGDYHAVRKSVMTTRLLREIAVYKDLVRILDSVTQVDHSEQLQLASWDELATVEKNESDAYSKLVDLQDQIITALLAGKAADSAQINEILTEVDSVQSDLNAASVRSSEIRGGLFST